MKMNDRSTVGNMNCGCVPAIETRTGLSLRRGGRCCGNSVCCFLGILWICLRSVIPGRLTLTATLPRTVTTENERFGAEDAGADGLVFGSFVLKVFELAALRGGAVGFEELTESCKSWAHGWLDGSVRI